MSSIEEIEARRGPELCAYMDARFGPPKPLTPEQVTLLAALLDVDPRPSR